MADLQNRAIASPNFQTLKFREFASHAMRWPAPSLSGWLAVVGAALIAVVAPFHGAAYFNTDDGSEDLTSFQESWGEGLRDAVPAAFNFADSYQVYKTYGVVTAVALTLLAIGFLGFHGAQDAQLTGWRRAIGRVACCTWVLLGLAALTEYLSPFTDQVFLVALPALLLSVILTAVYGFSTARRGAHAPWAARTLAVAALVFIPLVALFGHIPMGAYGFAVAWLAIGPRLARGNIGVAAPRPPASSNASR